MKTIILAAGQGKRLQPISNTRPKVMVPIANKPLLEHVILKAKKAGLTDFIILVSYRKEQIIEYFNDGSEWNVNIEYVDQGKPQGTAHAVASCQDHVSKKFLVLSGDTIPGVKDIQTLVKAKKITIGVTPVENPEDYGVIDLDDGNVKNIYEKVNNPPTNLINTGMYLLTDRIFKAIEHTEQSKRQEYEITDSFTWLISKGEKIQTTRISEWIDISRPWDILQANALLLQKMRKTICRGTIENHVTIHGNVSIGVNTQVLNGAYIEGPVIIGKNCKIGPNVYIRPFTSIGDNCHIGNACEVKNSVIIGNSNIPHQNYVGDSIIGEHCNLGAGTKIANLRLDKNPVHVSFQGTYINTGLRKLGAIIGDHVQTGINASINTGTIIGDHTFIGPGVRVDGTIASNTRII